MHRRIRRPIPLQSSRTYATATSAAAAATPARSAHAAPTIVEFSRHGARASTYLEYAKLLARDKRQAFDRARAMTDHGLWQHYQIGRQVVRPLVRDRSSMYI